jgi:hypothetical protein
MVDDIVMLMHTLCHTKTFVCLGLHAWIAH